MQTYNEALTDPRTHDPENFVYMTHGIVNWEGDDIDLTDEYFDDRICRIRDSSRFYDTSIIGVMSSEDAMKSLGYGKDIRNLNPAGSGGLILKPPEDSIYVAWNFDLGSPIDPESLKIWANRHRGKIKPPIRLLLDNHLDFYNHLVIRGDERTVIDGVFYLDRDSRAKEFGTMLKDSVVDVLGEDIPLVRIEYETAMPKNEFLWWVVFYLYAAYVRNPSRAMFYLPLGIQKRLGVVRNSETL